MKLYPLKFEPILKPLIWGGDKICQFKGITPEQKGIGESWEISGVTGSVSVVANGELAGESLDELIVKYKAELVGKSVYERFGDKFPLLIKFIDAKDNLSIQVHPGDEMAKKRHNSFGKTEMWYVLKSDPDAFLYIGFKKAMDQDLYVKSVEDNTFIDYLDQKKIKSGDVFFLPAGRVHAIGTGSFVAEIQQTSDITYRIYDYDRRDAQGNPRELHTDLAKDAITYDDLNADKVQYTSAKNKPVQLESCQYFTTNVLEMNEGVHRNYSKIDSFIIYICLEGECTIKDNKGNELRIKQGESVLIPASTQSIDIVAKGSAKLLETYV